MRATSVMVVVVGVAGCGRIGFAPLTASELGDGDGGGDDDGAVAPPDACGATVVLSDNFAAATASPQWTVAAAADVTIAQGSGTLAITFADSVAEGDSAGYTQKNAIDFTSACTIVELVEVPNAATTALTHLEIGTGTENVRFEVFEGNLRSIHQTGNLDDHLDIRAYDPVAHRYLRIRNVAGSAWYFDVSADGVAYTAIASKTGSSLPPTTTVDLSSGAAFAFTGGGTAEFASATIVR